MPGKSPTLEQILTTLADAPLRIAEFSAGLSEAKLHAAPGPGEWSVSDVLAHLRACGNVWGDCIVTIINQDALTIRAVNPRTWIEKTNYLEQDFQTSLQAYTVQRTELVAILKSSKPKVWSRSAKVTGAGKPLVRTVQSYAEWLVDHERPHLKQIKRIANTMREQHRPLLICFLSKIIFRNSDGNDGA